MNKLFCAILSITLALCFLSASFAETAEIAPRADTEFMSTTIVLKSSKSVSFRATTYEIKDSISISACWLQIENDDGTWTTVCSLPVPSETGSETISFSTSASYSSYIGTGTYRIRATFNADGHTVTVNSNERSF